MNKTVFILTTICALAIVAMVVALGAKPERSDADTEDAAADLNPTAQANEDWPLYRGGQRFAGVASGTLPDKPQLIWTFNTQQPIKSSAVIVGDRVYIGSDDDHLYCIDLQSGSKIWQYKTNGPIEAPPMVLDGTVYVGSWDSFMHAVDAKTGAVRWRYETGDKITGSANYVRRDNGAMWILFGSYDSIVYCVDAASGKLVWKYETEDYINGAPAISGSRAVIGGCDTRLHLVNLADGTVEKKIEVGAQIAASVALAGDNAFLGHYGEAFVALDLDSGEVAWTVQDPSRRFPFMSSAAVSDAYVVFGSRGRRLYCVDRATGADKWEFRARGNVDSSPVICGDKVVVGSESGRLYMLKLDSGDSLWEFVLGKPITASPAVSRGFVVIGCEDGNVYAFAEKKRDAANDKNEQKESN